MIEHIFRQGPVLASLGRTVFQTVRQRLLDETPSEPPPTPGPEFTGAVSPRHPGHVRDYVREVGGDPRRYRNSVPAHMFPQWGFPLISRTLDRVPYPLERMLNGGCRLEINDVIPADEPLHLSARLEDIDDDGRRAVLQQRFVTGTGHNLAALIAHLYVVVPLSRSSANGREKERRRVPDDARQVDEWQLSGDAGFRFACLTGDFNPIHWIPAAARSAGFDNTILHGFATLARSIEGMIDNLWAGDVGRLRTIDVQFRRPLVLPKTVWLYVQDNEVFVGDGPGSLPYLIGTFHTH